ncbi:ribonuclease [Candidatus Micrarchaeota archaeon CG10_big_fil_rev_8_21_14_0_10_59_7]|nr:MAG: ribonuclease [Candidatus Micrarchaeota archaeon CG10_big_fil_rev_8_21_14_0_10_59_7]
MIRTVVLGSGGSLPSPRHVPSSFAVKYGATYLFDCCEGCQRQMMKYGANYGQARAIFLSHLHADHFLGVFGLVQTLGMIGRKEELLIVGPAGTKRLFEAIFSQKELAPVFPIAVKEAREGVVLEERLFSVRAFPVKHGCKALGYALEEGEKTRFDEAKAKAKGLRGPMFTEIQKTGRLVVNGKTVEIGDITYKQAGKKIVYSGDTAPCAELQAVAKGADLLIHDSCFTEADAAQAKEKFHSTAKGAAECAKKAGAKRLLLTHASNRYEDRSPLLREAKAVFKEALMAEEGLEVLV